MKKYQVVKPQDIYPTNAKLIRRLAIMSVVILVADQMLKIWVKTHMYLGQDINLIGDWCMLHFVENVGFAFGTTFGDGAEGKLALSLFRILASVGLLWYMVVVLKKGVQQTTIDKEARTKTVEYQKPGTGLLVSLTLIIVGAFGNLVDSCFYGLIFSESNLSIATLFPPEGGYAPLLQGKVVDMFYFPLFESDWPQWVPLVGGEHFLFFSAIFNIADAAITVGAFWLIIYFIIQERKRRKAKKNAQKK